MQISFTPYPLLNRQDNVKLLHIRNKTIIRQNCENTGVIRLKNHLKWLKNDASRDYFAVKADEKIIGGLSLVLHDKTQGGGSRRVG